MTPHFETGTNRVTYDNYLMPFGKYIGHFMSDILSEDPEYFMWLYEKVTGDTKEAMSYLLNRRRN